MLYPDALLLEPDDVKRGKWREKADLFIMPGGRDIPYDRALRGKGNQQIREFVESGGKYLGICAGAYYGAAKVEFELGTDLEVNEERELAFYPGKAVGTLFPGFVYGTERGAHLVEVRTKTGTETFYYNGGCGFPAVENFPVVEVLGRIAGTGIAAIIRRKVGRGFAVLSGVHVEFGSGTTGYLFSGAPLGAGKVSQEEGSHRDAILSRVLQLLANLFPADM